MLASEFTREVETETGATDVSRLRILQALEPIEKPGDIVGRNPNPGVDHTEPGRLPIHVDQAANEPAVRRVLHGILQQVGDDGDESLIVAEDRHLIGRCLQRELMPSARHRPDDLECLIRDPPQVEVLALEHQLAVLQAGGVEHLRHQQVHLQRLGLEHLDGADA